MRQNITKNFQTFANNKITRHIQQSIPKHTFAEDQDIVNLKNMWGNIINSSARNKLSNATT